MNSAKIINIHKYIAKIHIILLFVYVVFYAIGIYLGIYKAEYSFRMIPEIVFSFFVLTDYIYARISSDYKVRIIRIIRTPMVMCVLANIMINTSQQYKTLISMILFVSFAIQILYFTDISRLRYKIFLFFIITIPFIIISLVKIVQMNDINFTINTIFFLLSLFIYMLFFIILTSRIFAESNLEINKLKRKLKKIEITKQNNDSVEVALDNAYEKLSHENSEMLVENLIQQYISSSLEISNLMKLILESLSEALVVNLCSIIVKGEYDETYQYNTRTIYNSIELESFNSYIEDGSLINKFRDLTEPYIDNQVKFNEYDFLAGSNIKSLLIYPLVNEGNWLGMLVIGKDTEDYFIDNMSFFERVSTQFSIALMNARVYTKMENMAMKDGLTGIYNRTYMIQRINEYISSVVLNKSSLAVLLFDIDKFKNVNDTFGHLFGDEVIRVCANTAREIAEAYNGFAARYGGEEFVIVCKEESMQELRKIAKMLHTQIKQTEVNYRGSTLYVNVSIGVAAFPATCNNPAELIDRADKAMYHSKLSGRGRITFDGEYTS